MRLQRISAEEWSNSVSAREGDSLPSVFTASMSAPKSTRVWTTWTSQRSDATMSGVHPPDFMALIRAPNSRSVRTESFSPTAAASNSGVYDGFVTGHRERGGRGVGKGGERHKFRWSIS